LNKTRDLVYQAAGIPQLQQAFGEAVEILAKHGITPPMKAESAASLIANAARV